MKHVLLVLLLFISLLGESQNPKSLLHQVLLPPNNDTISGEVYPFPDSLLKPFPHNPTRGVDTTRALLMYVDSFSPTNKGEGIVKYRYGYIVRNYTEQLVENNDCNSKSEFGGGLYSTTLLHCPPKLVKIYEIASIYLLEDKKTKLRKTCFVVDYKILEP